MTEVRTDFKRDKRYVDPDAMKTCVLRWRVCACCGEPAATAHHVYPRGQGGDDVSANLIAVCGDGTTGCHGDLEAMRDHARRRARKHLDARADTLAYLQGRLGPVPALDYIDRRYPR